MPGVFGVDTNERKENLPVGVGIGSPAVGRFLLSLDDNSEVSDTGTFPRETPFDTQGVGEPRGTRQDREGRLGIGKSEGGVEDQDDQAQTDEDERDQKDGEEPVGISGSPTFYHLPHKNAGQSVPNNGKKDGAQDFDGRVIDQIKNAIRRTLKGWGHINRLGVWISGGVDSSILLHLATQMVGSEKVRAYSLTFGEQDESEYAKRIAEWCDVKLILKEMTPTDGLNLTEEAVLCQRSPTTSTTVLYISKLCKHDGTKRVFSALGLDELQGGYPAHTSASDNSFFNLETDLLWKCQSQYVWLQFLQSKDHVAVKFPFLDPGLIAFCRGLPRNHKCVAQETKVRLRKELTKQSLIPKENIEGSLR